MQFGLLGQKSTMTSDLEKNEDVKKHLLNIEARLDRLSVPPRLNFDSLAARHDDEIDLREIWNILWDGKWWIVGITVLFSAASIIFALSLPNKYRAEVVLAPAQEQAGGLGGLAAQYGGLAAMAGINLGGGASKDIDQAMALVTSWPFLDAFVAKHDLKHQIVAAKGWDGASDSVIYDEDVYDPAAHQWLRESIPKRPSEPTSYEVYRDFLDMISVSRDTKSGLISLSVEHYVPTLAFEWVGLLVQELNNHFQERDVMEATRNIEYLRTKAQETGIAEMQLVFYRMIEAQMKTLMLAEVSDEYLVKTVVKPVLPEMKSSPKRMLICIVGTMLGGVLSMLVVIALNFLKASASLER